MTLSNIMLIAIGSTVLRATLVNNTSVEALKELLNKNPLTIEMNDYGNFEKVGDIGTTLPRNDVRITTEPGDIILYLGSSLCLYYNTNTYTFTRIGKIQDVTQEDLKRILGDGSVTVTFSLEKNDDDKSEDPSTDKDNTENTGSDGNLSSDHQDKNPIDSPEKPSSNNKSKTAIIAGTVSAAVVVVVVIAVIVTCYFKKVACFRKISNSESQA